MSLCLTFVLMPRATVVQCFLGVTKQGVVAVVQTHGNDNTQLILRGGSRGPNYDK